ncbi:MAG: prohead assembly (scaffolding) protein [Enterobacter phage ENC9]|jgi:NADH dehydrogenase/NADH:ubiquinone oxidoreductase subunit G|uniref:Prohead core scaffold protein n=3 Tax=Kanagawavirus TaxID=2843399 RepID=A0A6B9XXU3_9CAUD|nr:head scaffolding protein [Enterobacter phage vB_EclM_CIP9]YP_010650153.1 head scaffolding protein [Kosakonia phage 305]YP_010650435.1 head scaffolding protein [Enterobacter phage vB_EhoM-IME523]YP_010650735.1 head scaffolding protein [Enterobacter phage vB_EclM_Q7622]UIW11216.1 MAG: prohead assembly (scaffolding) protein [Enterobacter phage ENC9]UTY64423.1 prohead core protein [Enterobacter phage Entb_45]QEA10663.1 prohead core protein [Enterobacter phage vB_EhoM-IME523]QHS01831.1 prohead
MLKEQLMTEAQNIDVSVALDSIFESVNISPEARETFGTVFEATVKQQAIKLAESHIESIAEKAEEKVAKAKEEAEEKAEKDIQESVARFLDHLGKEWLAENKLAVDRGIKADLFESVMGGMKELFVEHNVVIPEEAVDVVAEMEEELAEQKQETARLFEEVTKRDAYINYVQRETVLGEATRELTESQKEKVSSLVEGMEYSDSFPAKLDAIVNMVKGSITESGSNEKPITEGAINTPEDDAAALNFVSEPVVEQAQKPAMSLADMAALAASRIS